MEDSPATSELLCDVLKGAGHDVVCAQDGLEALMLLKNRASAAAAVAAEARGSSWGWPAREAGSAGVNPALPTVILTDIQMPRMDGYAFTSALASDRDLRHIPVIVLTTKSKMDQPFKELPNVAVFLVKPPQPEVLVRVIQEAIARGGAK